VYGKCCGTVDSSTSSRVFPDQGIAVAVDALVFTVAEGELRLALIRRGIEPRKGCWAIPGGFVLPGESLEEAALREVREEAGVQEVYLEQLYTFGAPDRDPRARVVSVAYFALAPAHHIHLSASTDAAEAGWFPVGALPPLAFDHAEIVRTGIERLKSKLEYSSIAWALLPDRFRLSELQAVYEAILGRPLDKRNFRKRILSLGLLEPTEQVDTGGAHRPARLYRFGERRPVLFDSVSEERGEI
jgi:8-oxo-dGTP diphosphatase